MNRRNTVIIILTIILVLLLIFAGWLIYDAYNGDSVDSPENVANKEDMASLAETNADTAFVFLSESNEELPDDVRGYYIDIQNDIDISSGDENQVMESVDAVFDKVDAILPNTVVIPIDIDADYTVENTDYLAYLIEQAKNEEMTVFLEIAAADIISSDFDADLSKAEELLESYSPDGIMLDGIFDMENATADNIASSVASVREYFASSYVKTGLTADESMTDIEEETVLQSVADFIFVKINSSSETGAENYIKSWASAALNSTSKVYAVIRNDLVATGSGWTLTNEVLTQVKMLYNYGGFSGCVMYSREKLSEDDNDTATNLYGYYEYFNNVDYTALDLTDFDIVDNETVVISGTSETGYDVFSYSTADGCWQTVTTQDDDGSFTVELPLIQGENKISIKHKNAMYIYYIDKAVDVMTDCSAVIEDNVLTLTATALSGSDVWASLANTVPVELSEVSTEGDYSVYSAEYELTDGFVYLTEDLVSFASVYNGIEDIVMCSEEADVTPYNDHSLGTATMCVVTENYAETTSTAADDDSSDPTCTPQLAGSYGYVESYTVSDNYVIYILNTGMKIYASATKLILDGYRLPDNGVTLVSIDTEDETTITLSSTYPCFVKFNLDPQEYYEGYLQRIYNVTDFTAEYVDIIFMDTSACSVVSEPDFSDSSVISSAEWYTNSDDKFITLRLYLQQAGKFSGYSFSRNEDGDTVISFKNDKSSLEGTVIMLDPGHGGYGSPGTSLNNNIYEKDITMSIALLVADILEEYGAEVILTRDDDEAVFLEERVEMIRTIQPDVFVSIHCDGADDTTCLGTHTFYYKSYSMPLAYSIHQQLLGAYRNYYYTDTTSDEYEDVDKGYKFFPYMVTRVEECPSVLVECGYLTNTQDAAFLCDDAGQQILATAIAQGIVDYLVNY